MRFIAATLFVALGLVVACGGKAEKSNGSKTIGSNLPEHFALAQPPENHLDVLAAREQTSTGEKVTVVGKVGGAKNVFVESRAVFTLVDLSLVDCYSMPGDHCPTPWDYCCEDSSELAKGKATIEFQEDGKLLPTTARGFHGIDHGKIVIVTGTADKDEAGNLTVVADGVYVRP